MLTAGVVGIPVKALLIASALAAYVIATPMSCDNDPAGWFLWLAAVLAFPVAFVWAGSSFGIASGLSRLTSVAVSAAVYLLVGVAILGIAALTYDLGDANQWTVLLPAM